MLKSVSLILKAHIRSHIFLQPLLETGPGKLQGAFSLPLFLVAIASRDKLHTGNPTLMKIHGPGNFAFRVMSVLTMVLGPSHVGLTWTAEANGGRFDV